MLSELKWLSINQMCAESRLLEAWKTANDPSLPLNEVVKFKKDYPNIVTRSQKFKVMEQGKPCRLFQNSFAYPTARIWNMAPGYIKNAKNVSAAKSKIRDFVQKLPY